MNFALDDTPYHRLILAVNHYITTADIIGAGVFAPGDNGRILLNIPVNRHLVLDRLDFDRLQARVGQLKTAFSPHLHFLDRNETFDFWALSLREEEVESFARELRRAPGPLGWGSPKAFVDEHERRVKEGEKRFGRLI